MVQCYRSFILLVYASLCTQGASLADREELMAALEEAQSLSETR